MDIIDYGFVVRICGSPKGELAQLVIGESALVLHGLVQSDILGEHSETAYMNVNV